MNSEEPRLGNSPSMLIWVEWKSPSENVIRGKHWTVALRQKKAGLRAWVSALRSSPSEHAKLTTIISLLGSNACETLLHATSALTTATRVCDGSAAKSKPEGVKEPSFELK